MIAKLFNALFGCRHKRTAFPITNRKQKRTYIVCLECGREIPFSWEEMRRVAV